MIQVTFPPAEEKYPCLKITEKGLIVLFTDLDEGVCLRLGKGDDSNWVGMYSTEWAEDECFKLYNGSIVVIKNT